MTVNISRVKRWLAGGLAVLPLAVTGLVAIFLFQQSAATSTDMRKFDVAIDRAENELLQIEQLKVSLRDLDNRQDETAVLFQEESHTVAAARLSRVLDEMVRRVGGYRSSMQILDPIIHQPFDQVVVRLQAELSIMSLRDFLYEVETYPVVLAVRQLSMRAVGDHDADGMLLVELVVAGHLQSAE